VGAVATDGPESRKITAGKMNASAMYAECYCALVYRDVKFSKSTWSRGQILRSRSRSRSHDIVLVLVHLGLVASTTRKLITD